MPASMGGNTANTFLSVVISNARYYLQIVQV
jgi:hypothetical protein